MASAFSAATSLIFLLFLSISSPSVTGNSAPAANSCSLLVTTNLVGCMTFVVVGNKDDKPLALCCSGLKKVLDTNPECLCEGLKQSGDLGVKVNMTKAETLPAACNLQAPPVASCKLPNTPANAPAPVPASGPKSGPGTASAPAPSPSSHGSSLTPVSGLSFVISGALVVLFPLI